MDSGEYRLRPHRERSRRLACPHAGWRTAGYSPLEAGSGRARRQHGAVTALAIGIWPDFPVVFTALVLHGTTGAFLGPAIAAISLGVVGHLALPEQLGRNQRFASAGSLIATGLMGLIGYLLSYQAMFLIAAALGLPLLLGLA